MDCLLSLLSLRSLLTVHFLPAVILLCLLMVAVALLIHSRYGRRPVRRFLLHCLICLLIILLFLCVSLYEGISLAA